MRIVVIGDTLLDVDLQGVVRRSAEGVSVLDVADSRSRAGGAGLAALLVAAEGTDVTLVTALASDAGGATLLRLLHEGGVDVVNIGTDGATAEKLRVQNDGTTLVRADRGGPPGQVGVAGPAVHSAVVDGAAVLVSDYGRGVAGAPSVRDLLATLPARTPLVWDPHPRGPEPAGHVTLATPNDSEAKQLVTLQGDGIGVAATRARELALRWETGVAVTLGSRGAVLATIEGTPLVVPALASSRGDPCGAGDCFAACAIQALAGGATIAETVQLAVRRSSAFVGAGGAGATDRGLWPGRAGNADDVAAQVRASKGVIVGTGGCFDVLHPGHVAMLTAARRLGDCLIVFLNSDESVRRLKGPGRPVRPQAARAAALASLDCVDAVTVFDDDTPVAALERLRPALFVKGGDYGAKELPEAATLARWGGTAVVVPYLAGSSTSALVHSTD